MFPPLFSLNIVNNIPNRIMVGSTVAPPTMLSRKSMQCNNAISECKMMLASIMPSVGIIDEVNLAI